MATDINLLVEEPWLHRQAKRWPVGLAACFLAAAVWFGADAFATQRAQVKTRQEIAHVQQQIQVRTHRPLNAAQRPIATSTASQAGMLYGRVMTALSQVSVQKIDWVPGRTDVTGEASSLGLLADAMDQLTKLPGVASVALNAATAHSGGGGISFDLTVHWGQSE